MDFDAQEQLLQERRKRYAQQLAGAQAPQGRMVGNVFVAPSALEYLAAGLRGVGGMKGEAMAEQELGQLRQQRSQGTQQALADFLRQSQGTPGDVLPEDQQGPVRPAQAPDMRGAFGALLQAPDASLRQAGMQGMIQIPQMEAAAAQRAADLDFRRSEAEANRQARIDQLNLAHQQRMDSMAAQNATRQEMAEAQRQFQREMAQMRAQGGGAGGGQAYYQPIQTAQGVFAFNARTGQVEQVQGPGGAPIVGAAADPALQATLAAGKAAAQTEAKANVEARRDAPQSIEQANNSLRLIDELLTHPGFKTSVGVERIAPLRMIPGTPQADFESRLGQLQGSSFLQAFESLKGGGQITEVEGQKATQAINRMNAATSEREFKAAADELRTILRQGISRAERAQQRPDVRMPTGMGGQPAQVLPGAPANMIVAPVGPQTGGAQPAAPVRGLSAQDQQALDWARANPRDPRSAAIMQRLGVQ